MLNRFVFIVLLLVSTCVARAADLLPVKIVILLKQDPNQAAAPFEDVAGITIKRSMLEFAGAACPDPSNNKGEVFCKVMCNTSDSSMRLHMFAPTRERSRIVAGLTQPSAVPLDIVGCKVTSKLPINVIYRTAWVVLEEIRAKSPKVVAAVVADSKYSDIKPFELSSGELQALSSKPENREAILGIGRVASLQQEALQFSPTKRPFPGSEAKRVGYAVGVRSIALKTAVAEAGGELSPNLVQISPDSQIYYRNIKILEQELNKKRVLNKKEIQLADDLSQLKRDWSSTSFGFTSEDWGLTSWGLKDATKDKRVLMVTPSKD